MQQRYKVYNKQSKYFIDINTYVLPAQVAPAVQMQDLVVQSFSAIKVEQSGVPVNVNSISLLVMAVMPVVVILHAMI